MSTTRARMVTSAVTTQHTRRGRENAASSLRSKSPASLPRSRGPPRRGARALLGEPLDVERDLAAGGGYRVHAISCSGTRRGTSASGVLRPLAGPLNSRVAPSSRAVAGPGVFAPCPRHRPERSRTTPNGGVAGHDHELLAKLRQESIGVWPVIRPRARQAVTVSARASRTPGPEPPVVRGRRPDRAAQAACSLSVPVAVDCPDRG